MKLLFLFLVVLGTLPFSQSSRALREVFSPEPQELDTTDLSRQSFFGLATSYKTQLKSANEAFKNLPVHAPLKRLQKQLKREFGERGLNAVIMAQGTRGDVQPFLGLARYLQDHSRFLNISLLTFDMYKSEVEKYKVQHCTLMGHCMDAGTLADGIKNQAEGLMSRDMSNDETRTKTLVQAEDLVYSVTKAISHADIVLFWSPGLAAQGGDDYTAKLIRTIVPAKNRLLIDLRPTVIPEQYTRMITRRGLRQPTVSATEQALMQEHEESFNMMSFFYGAMPNNDKVPILVGWSSMIAPKTMQTKSNKLFMGQWVMELDPDYQPPFEIRQFLKTSKAKNKVVYIGFGSMVDSDFASHHKVVCDAINQTPYYYIWAPGWNLVKNAGLTEDDLKCNQRTFVLKEFVHHGWLFPRVDAVVHHGGAGTFQTVARSKVPMVVVPYIWNGDQFIFSALANLNKIGIGLEKNPTAATLASAIDTVLSDTEIARRAHAFGTFLASESGNHNTLDFLTRYIYAKKDKLTRGPGNRLRDIATNDPPAACLKFEQPFLLRYVNSGVYCGVDEDSGALLCESNNKEDATPFTLQNVANVLKPTEREVPLAGNAFLTYSTPSGKQSFTRVKDWTSDRESYLYSLAKFDKTKTEVKLLPADFFEREGDRIPFEGVFDYCVRDADRVRLLVNGKYVCKVEEVTGRVDCSRSRSGDEQNDTSLFRIEVV